RTTKTLCAGQPSLGCVLESWRQGPGLPTSGEVYARRIQPRAYSWRILSHDSKAVTGCGKTEVRQPISQDRSRKISALRCEMGVRPRFFQSSNKVAEKPRSDSPFRTTVVGESAAYVAKWVSEPGFSKAVTGCGKTEVRQPISHDRCRRISGLGL